MLPLLSTHICPMLSSFVLSLLIVSFLLAHTLFSCVLEYEHIGKHSRIIASNLSITDSILSLSFESIFIIIVSILFILLNHIIPKYLYRVIFSIEDIENPLSTVIIEIINATITIIIIILFNVFISFSPAYWHILICVPTYLYLCVPKNMLIMMSVLYTCVFSFVAILASMPGTQLDLVGYLPLLP